MPVLSAPLDPVTIASLKGTLDYYLWRGLPVIRKWPRKPTMPRTPASTAAAVEFGQVASLLSDLPAPWRSYTEADVANTNWTWRDEWTAAAYGNLFTPKKEAPVYEEIPMPTYLPGRYYTTPALDFATTTIVTAAGTIRALAFYVPAPTTFDQLAWEITATTGGTDRLAIYGPFTNDPSAAPLLVDTGNVAIAATGVKTASIGISLAAGWYLICLQNSVQRTYRGLAVGNFIAYLGQGTAGAVRPAHAIERTIAYAAYGATFGAVSNYNNSTTAPLIWLRCA